MLRATRNLRAWALYGSVTCKLLNVAEDVDRHNNRVTIFSQEIIHPGVLAAHPALCSEDMFDVYGYLARTPQTTGDDFHSFLQQLELRRWARWHLECPDMPHNIKNGVDV
jgi:hypothetical protein